MPRQAATFPRVNAFDRRAAAAAGCRRAVCASVGIGLGTVTTAGLMAGSAAVAAAWLVSTALGGIPQIRAPLVLDTASFSGRYDAFAAAPHVAAAKPALPQVAAAAPPSGRLAASFDLFDPETSANLPGAAAAARAPQPRLAERNTDVPLPLPRRRDDRPIQPPRDIAGPPPKPAAPQLATAAPAASAGSAGSAAPLLALLEQPPAPRPQTDAMALPGADGHTAIYDIVAHTVYMPNGLRLEAHSGLGDRLDDPRYVDERGRGPTPPNVYNLALRGAPFHGVEAIRLNPVDDDRMFGRAGILAHPYMLGPSGQSFGCVSFKDYSEFLAAFERGNVDRLVVVRHLDTRISGNAPARHGYARYAVNDR